MSGQARTSRVLVALIVSMTAGAVVLMVLDNGALPRGAFSLSVFNRLPSEDIVMNYVAEGVAHCDWERIEVFYSETASGNVKDLSLLNRLEGRGDLKAHFVICNGRGGVQGEIQATEQWIGQQPFLVAGDKTIRICVVADSLTSKPTEWQVRRADDLIKLFAKKFDIHEKISRPAGTRP